nr:MAG TPA: hypothetical protein [Caudoviricetes sp.]
MKISSQFIWFNDYPVWSSFYKKRSGKPHNICG